jgi:hypothetical protein
MFGLVWIAVGCLVGAMAAEKRGLSMPIALIAGGLLGILSPLLFFVQPPTPTRKCPKCAENVKANASVCRYCRSDLVPVVVETPSASMSAFRVLGVSVLGVVVIIGGLVGLSMLIKALAA